MKISVIFLLILTNFCNGQTKPSGKITYIKTEVKNPNSLEHIDMWFCDNQYAYRYRVKDFRLSNDYQKFKNEALLTGDTVEFEKRIDSLNSINNHPLTNTFFGKLNDIQVVNSLPIERNNYVCVKDTLNNLISWTLTEDTVNLSGVLCQKAEGTSNGKDYIAWFALNIPVSVAPFQLRGLPGLLIKLQNITSGVTLIGVNIEWPTKEAFDMLRPTCTNLLSKLEFKKLKEEGYELRMNKIKNAKNITDIIGILNN